MDQNMLQELRFKPSNEVRRKGDALKKIGITHVTPTPGILSRYVEDMCKTRQEYSFLWEHMTDAKIAT